MEVGRWKLGDGSWEMEDGSWKMEDGRWKMEDGRWKMEDGRWKMEVGSWKMEVGVPSPPKGFAGHSGSWELGAGRSASASCGETGGRFFFRVLGAVTFES